MGVERNGFVERAALAQQSGQEHDERTKRWRSGLPRQRRTQRGLGLLDFALVALHLAQIGGRQRVVGAKREGAGERLLGLGQASKVALRVAEVVPGAGVIRIDAQGGFEGGEGALGVAAFAEQDAEVAVRRREAGLQLDRPAQARARALKICGGLLRLGQRVMRQRMARCAGDGAACVRERGRGIAALAQAGGEHQVRGPALRLSGRACDDCLGLGARRGKVALGEPPLRLRHALRPGCRFSHRALPRARPDSCARVPAGTPARDAAYAPACRSAVNG